MKKNKKEKKFAKSLCFDKLFLIFVIGCVFGAFYEEILALSKHFLKTNEIVYSTRRGVLYGPISPIYGFGIYLMTVILNKTKNSKIKAFICAALLGGIIEYIICFLQETFIGTISWNYSNHFLNINGRTTIPFMIFWGALGIIYIYHIYPYLSKLIESIPYKVGKKIVLLLVIFLSFDAIVSWTALGRQYFRRQGHKPFTIIGEIYDKIYPDEYLNKKFPNMMPK